MSIDPRLMRALRLRSTTPLLCLLLTLGLTALVGCGGEPAPSAELETADETTPPSGPVSGTVTAPDGVPIAYEARGQGDTAVVFIHCWSCDRTFWQGQMEALEEGYRVVAIDLPGHGESGTGREEWRVTAFAEDVAAVADELDLGRMILVGHSMGGPVALAAAARMPERTIGVGCVDTLHNADLVWPPEMAEQLAAGFEADFGGTMDSMMGSMFPPEADPAAVEQVLTVARGAHPPAAVGLLRDFARLDMPALFSEAGVPIRCINAAQWNPQALVTAVEVNRQYADFDVVEMSGVGHFPHLEKPQEFNRLLADQLAAIEAIADGEGGG